MRHVRPKVVIIGASGFIGSALARRFKKSGRCQVKGFGSRGLDLTQKGSWKRLARQLDRRTTLILAARSRKGKRSAKGFMQEVAIAGNAARAMFAHRIKKCVYISSSSVYGDLKTNLGITEKTTARPSSFYGAAKLAGEQILERAARERSFSLVVLRPCMIYGPGSRDREAYGPMKFARSVRKSGEIRFFGDGRELRDYVFIDDFAEIVYRFASGRQEGVYNVASGKSISFQKLASEFERVFERRIHRIKGRRDRPKTSQRFKMEKMKKQLPGFRFTSLRKGLKALLYSDVKFKN